LEEGDLKGHADYDEHEVQEEHDDCHADVQTPFEQCNREDDEHEHDEQQKYRKGHVR
jgi:hypothetical protein